MTPAAVRFVILATPRSGSNWLCTLLDSHTDILCHHELFNPEGIHVAWSRRGSGMQLAAAALPGRDAAAMNLLDQVWSEALGCRAVGFKLNAGQDETAFAAVLDDPSIRKILLFRRNRVRAFLSENIAELTGQWESYPDSPAPPATGPVRLDVASLLAHALRNREYCDDLRRRMADSAQPLFEISYESIGSPPAQARLLAFLGVDPTRPLRGTTRRMNPGALSRLIANYGELQSALAGTDLAGDLAEDADDRAP